ncbi:MAG: hypothetical protein M3Q73_04400 [bacterium]|nr:hypothetical protein [bacterium]
MNKKLWAGIAGVVVLLILIVAAMNMNKDEAAVVPNENENQVQGTETSQQSLKEIIASNKPVKCEYSSVQPDGSSVSGTSYVANGKVRGDFSSTINGTAITGHTLIDGTTMYTWVDGQKEGFKLAINTSGSSTPSNQAVDLDAKADYDCSSWNPDTASFVLPTNITFTDMSAYMNTQGGASVPQR